MMDKRHYSGQYNVGLRIQQLRKENDIKQMDLANQIGVDRTSLSSYENGKRTPDIYLLWSIADIFDVTIDYLVGRENEKKGEIRQE